MTEQELIREICEKEDKSALYDIIIGGLPAYSMIRGPIRYSIIENNGLPVLKMRSPVKGWIVCKSVLLSCWHLLRLWCSNRCYPSVYYAFARVDKVGDEYLDKFTDPIIGQCEKKGSYLILDYGRAGVHFKPRVHSETLVYLDLLSALSRSFGLLFHKLYSYKYKREFSWLFKELNVTFGQTFDKSFIIRDLASNWLYVNLLRRIFKKVSAERVVGPARAFMAAPFVAAKRQGMMTIELQHGITYGETVLYSGYRDEKIIPDFFFAFGDNKPKDVYGIDEDRIINIGWAFRDYVAKFVNNQTIQKDDVLVISDPEITDAIISTVLQLAVYYPESTFYIRPHPHEIITEDQRIRMNQLPNVRVQDNSINITVALQGFNQIIGENSTVLYEALAIHKKVGKLFFEGLNPVYLEEGDRDCFWEIRNQGDFEAFMKGDVEQKKSKCIYSPFNKEKYMEITGIQS